jgi:HK97 gp10 family phage protein
MRTKRTSQGRKIFTATRRHAFDTIAEGVAVGEQVAKQLAAVDTGFMQEHTRGESDGQGKGKLESTAHYAKFVELGTSKMAAQPFFRPGDDAARQFIKANMRVVKR